jgi:hypothetical protein
MARRRTDAERRREVEGWRASSESVKKYAARRGYSETTLRKWIATENAGSRVPSAMPELLRVVARSSVGSALSLGSADDAVVVEVGAARIRVTRAFDAPLLRSVVLALSESAP